MINMSSDQKWLICEQGVGMRAGCFFLLLGLRTSAHDRLAAVGVGCQAEQNILLSLYLSIISMTKTPIKHDCAHPKAGVKE